MAAILRSSVGKAARRAFSMEGTFSVHPLHAGRPTTCTPTLGASYVKQFPMSSNSPSVQFPKHGPVDPLVKKIQDVAHKEFLIESMERLAQEQKSGIISPHPLGVVASTCFLAISFAGLYLAGHWVGFYEAVKYQASNRKQI